MITHISRIHLSYNRLASTTLCDHERKKGERWRNETIANWANSLSQRYSITWRCSFRPQPYSPYSHSSLVRSIVPSFTHIPLLSHERRGRFISYLLNFIKHPGRQHGCIFHFLVSAGIVQKENVAENGERGGRGMTTSGHSRSLSFFLRSSSLFLPVIFLFICTSVRADLSFSRCLRRSVS